MKADVRIVGSYFDDYFHMIKKGRYSSRDSAGGIANINNYSHQYATDENIAHYLISDNTENVPVACVKWGDDSYIDNIAKSLRHSNEPDWIHFMYANTIENLDIWKFKAECISCDLSNGPRPGIPLETVLRNVSKCDIVFMSSHHENFNEVLDAANDALTIVHDETGSQVYKHGYTITRYGHPREDFMFVTGAGDKFAGFYIEASLMKHDLSIKQKLAFAHLNILEWLRETNEKI